tara:strand:- start:130 stop:570 length:441 start_codon:yes stop_codon:yes gene_type:complete
MSNKYLNYFILKVFLLMNENENDNDFSRIFELDNKPKTPLDKFIYIFSKKVELSEETILVSLCILNKIKKKILINEKSIYLFSIFLFRIADKYHEDKHFYNDYWAEVINMKLKDFNYLEYKLLSLLNFNVHVSIEEYNNVNKNLCV